MEIFDVHHPLIFVFGLLGNLVSICVYIAPIPTFIQICKRKSTLGFHSLPYVVSLFSALLWLYYAALKGGEAFLLITINSLGCFIELVYIIIFLIYATRHSKKQTLKVLSGIFLVCLVISLGTFFLFNKATRVTVVGWVCVGVSVCVFAAPLSIVFQVVKSRSVEFMPLPLSCFLTLSAMIWFAYGSFLNDLCVKLPNVLGFVLGTVQMALYTYYKYRSKVQISTEVKQQPEHIINISVLSNAEVHPVDSVSSSSSSSSASEEAEDEKDNEDIGEESFDDSKCRPAARVEDEPCRRIEVTTVKPLETPVLVVCAA